MGTYTRPKFSPGQHQRASLATRFGRRSPNFDVHYPYPLKRRTKFDVHYPLKDGELVPLPNQKQRPLALKSLNGCTPYHECRRLSFLRILCCRRHFQTQAPNGHVLCKTLARQTPAHTRKMLTLPGYYRLTEQLVVE